MVSICIPIYNGEKYLEECLDSAIKQTYRPLEIVLSDDQSSDRSLEMVNSVSGRTDIPFHIHRHSPAGIGANWNNCVQKSNGEYIKFLFQDDLLDPSCIERMMQKVIESQQIAFVSCERKIISNGHLSIKWSKEWIKNNSDLSKFWDIERRQQVSGNEILRSISKRNIFKNFIGEPTAVLFRKSLAIENGGFDGELKQLLDLEAWLRFMRNTNLAFIEEPLVSFRLHDEQESFKNSGDHTGEYLLFKEKVLPAHGKFLDKETLVFLKKYPKKSLIEWMITLSPILFLRYRIGIFRRKVMKLLN